MNTLRMRKELLIAESELNRVQLGGELAVLVVNARELGTRARSYTVLASSAALLMTGLCAFRNNPATTRPKHLWLERLLKGAELAGSLWLAFRSTPR